MRRKELRGWRRQIRWGGRDEEKEEEEGGEELRRKIDWQKKKKIAATELSSLWLKLYHYEFSTCSTRKSLCTEVVSKKRNTRKRKVVWLAKRKGKAMVLRRQGGAETPTIIWPLYCGRVGKIETGGWLCVRPFACEVIEIGRCWNAKNSSLWRLLIVYFLQNNS